MRVYLVGLMGSGKTTVGKKLAKKLNFKFIDLDDMIESKSNITIAEFFEKFGQENFRLFEQKTLIETFDFQNVIISTGGGVPCFFDNMDEILKNGISIYLKANANLLFHRLKDSRENRPLINKLTDEQLMDNLTELLSKREKFYSKAHFIVDAVNPLDEMIEFIEKRRCKF